MKVSGFNGLPSLEDDSNFQVEKVKGIHVCTSQLERVLHVPLIYHW